MKNILKEYKYNIILKEDFNGFKEDRNIVIYAFDKKTADEIINNYCLLKNYISFNYLKSKKVNDERINFFIRKFDSLDNMINKQKNISLGIN